MWMLGLRVPSSVFFSALNSKLSDTGRRCKLTLKIDNLDDFVAAKAEVKGEPVQLSGFEWCLAAEPENSALTVTIDCNNNAERWHCKANYVVRLTSTNDAELIKESRSVFDNEIYGWGFTEMVTLSVSNT